MQLVDGSIISQSLFRGNRLYKVVTDQLNHVHNATIVLVHPAILMYNIDVRC